MPEKFSSDAPVLRTDASLLKDGPGTPIARGAPDTCPGFRPYEGQGQSFQDTSHHEGERAFNASESRPHS